MRILTVLQWIAAILLILSLATVAQKPLLILSVIAGILILPPVMKQIQGRAKIPNYAFWLIGVVGLFVAIANQPPKMAKQLLAEEESGAQSAKEDSIEVAGEERAKVERQIDYDKSGAYVKTERLVKNALKDPDSYQQIKHTEWHIGESGQYIGCVLEYRAKNGFGGYAPGKGDF